MAEGQALGPGTGRLSVDVRLFAAERDRQVVTGVLLAVTGSAAGITAVLPAGVGGPKIAPDVT
jgi:ubiquinone biosynthesis protein